MERIRSQVPFLATALLGVIAVSAFVAGVFILFGAWVTQHDAGGGLFDEVGTVGATLVGVLTIVFALLAALAAHEEWLGRPRGRMLGLVVAIVAVLTAVVVLLVGNVDGRESLFYVAAALGVVTALPLLVPESRPTTSGTAGPPAHQA
jgi:hypothetical protein